MTKSWVKQLRKAVLALVLGCCLGVFGSGAARADASVSTTEASIISRDDIDCRFGGPASAVEGPLHKRLASVERVVFFAHGFDLFAPEGRRTHAQVAQDFANYISIVGADGADFATCTVRWRSVKGFGPDQGALARAIDAVQREAATQRPRDRPKAITLVGFSAGGNYVKDAAVQARLLRSPVAAWSSPVRVVTIATPHRGVPLVQVATESAGGILTSVQTALGSNAGMVKFAEQHLSALRAERGIRQLLDGPENLDLTALNDTFFRAATADVEFFNIYSASDETVPARSAEYVRGRDFSVPAAFHFDMLKAPAAPEVRDLFLRIVSGERVKLEAPQ